MSQALKHVAIREYVRDLVAGSAPGTAAPSERHLVERFGVARMTVRQALDGLVAEGVLERFPGRGTYVAHPRRLPTGVRSLGEDLAGRGSVLDARTLVARRLRPPADLARALGIREVDPVVHWRRLRMVDGRPFCLSDAFLPDHLVPGLLEHLPESLYDDLARRGCRPTWAEDSLSAGIASDDEAQLLEVGPGAVVLRHGRRALWGETVVEVSRTVFRDQHTVSLRLRA